jgi:hypothetical protein
LQECVVLIGKQRAVSAIGFAGGFIPVCRAVRQAKSVNKTVFDDGTTPIPLIQTKQNASNGGKSNNCHST